MWQPIETAPRDGTKILVYTVHGDIELTEWYALEHDVYEPAGDDLFRKRREVYAKGWNGNRPTHWMPLPIEIPADAEEARRRVFQNDEL